MTPSQLVALIGPILDETLERTLNDLTNWILRFVPNRTGQLRRALLHNMTKSNVRGSILKFIIGSNLRYAQKVNLMSVRQVRHASWFEHRGRRKKVKGKRIKRRPPARRAYAYYGGHRGRIFLDDPEAKGKYFDELLRFLEKRAMLHMKVAIRKHFGKQKPLPWVII